MVSVQQPALFATETDAITEHGYRAPAAARAAGITYRQLDYWARTSVLTPSLDASSGSGTQRLYSFRDIVVLRVIKRLLTAGISLASVRAAVQWMHETDLDVAGLTLLSDGVSVYAETSPDVILDVLSGGQAVFAIGLQKVAHDAAVSLVDVPDSEKVTPLHADDGPQPAADAPRLRVIAS